MKLYDNKMANSPRKGRMFMSEKNIDDIIMHKALIYDLVNEVELADIFYQQSINSSKNINVINYYLNFLHRNNMEKT